MLLVLMLQLAPVLTVQVALCVSSFTPFSMSAVLSHFPSTPLSVFNISQSLLSSAAPVLLDYTYNSSLSLLLLETYDQSLVICMHSNCPPQTLRAKLSPEQYAQQLGNYLVDFNWTKAVLVMESQGYYREIGSRLMQVNGLDLSDNVVIEREADEEKIGLVVGRIVKPSGNKIGVFLVSNAQRVLEQLESFAIWKGGYAYLFAEEAGWISGYDGLLYTTDSTAVNASSREEFEANILYSQLTALQEGAGCAEFLSPQKLQAAFQGFSRNISLAVVNHSQGRKQLQSHSLASSGFLFPGNSSAVPNVGRSILEVAVDYQGLNSDGTQFPSAAITMRGYLIGFEDANKGNDVLANYDIVNNSLSIGGLNYNETWARQQVLSHRASLGLAYYPYGGSATTIGAFQVLQKLDIHIPVSTAAIADALSDPQLFPLFFRTRANSKTSAMVMARFFSVFGWKRTALVHSDAQADMDFYTSFLSVSAQYGIQITNTDRLIPLGFASVQAQANQTLLAILQSAVRIIIVASSESYNVTERLYDLGARAGDYEICLFYGLDYTFYAGADEASFKRRNVIKGGMMFYDRFFVGAEGAKVKQQLVAADGTQYEPLGCAMYDSVWLLVHALDFMLTKALPFESGPDLMAYIRKTRFIGCTGIVQLESGTNDRITGDYSILNAHYDPSTDTLTLTDVATYSPARVQMYNISTALQFPDNSLQFLDTWPLDNHCPYYLREIREFPRGELLGLIISLYFLLIATITALLAWLFWRHLPITDLRERKTLTSEDALFFLSLGVEFCQLLSLAPALSQPSFPLLRLSNMQWEGLMNFDHGVYWALVLVACGAVGLQMGYMLWRMNNRCVQRCSHSCVTLGYFVDLLGPVFMRLTYIPIVLTLASAFHCYYSVGEDYTDSYLNRDCYEKCWSEKHLGLAVLSAVLLLLYIPLVAFTQTLWEELQPNLHIHSRPLPLSLKLLTHTLLPLAFASLPAYSSTAHAVLYTATVGVYFLTTVFFKPYNYERVNLWARILVFAALVYGVVAAIGMAEAWGEIAIVASFLTLLGAGELAQVTLKRYRSLLERKVEDKSDIIKFAFTFGAAARLHLYHYVEKQKQYREVSSVGTINRLTIS